MISTVSRKKQLFFFASAVTAGIYALVARPLIRHACHSEALLNKISSGRMGKPTADYCVEKIGQLSAGVFLLPVLVIAMAWLFLRLRQKIQPQSNLKLSSKIFSSLGVILILFLAHEAAFRAFQKIKFHIPFFQMASDNYHPRLGWKGTQILGDPQSTKLKVLFLGDSMTQAREVSESSKFYALLRERLNLEISVYSNAGYGTLQEYIAMDLVFDQVKPDLIVLQVHPNDFVNNSWELESQSHFANKLIPKPYLMNGEIRFLFPRRHQTVQQIRFTLSNYSRLMAFLFNVIEKFMLRLWQLGAVKSVETKIEKQGLAYTPFKTSVENTDAVIKWMKARAGNTPVLAFTTDDKPPYQEALKTVFERNKVPYLEEIPNMIRQAEQHDGISLRGRDGIHWNAEGHAVAAAKIEEFISGYSSN